MPSAATSMPSASIPIGTFKPDETLEQYPARFFVADHSGDTPRVREFVVTGPGTLPRACRCLRDTAATTPTRGNPLA